MQSYSYLARNLANSHRIITTTITLLFKTFFLDPFAFCLNGDILFLFLSNLVGESCHTLYLIKEDHGAIFDHGVTKFDWQLFFFACSFWWNRTVFGLAELGIKMETNVNLVKK